MVSRPEFGGDEAAGALAERTWMIASLKSMSPPPWRSSKPICMLWPPLLPAPPALLLRTWSTPSLLTVLPPVRKNWLAPLTMPKSSLVPAVKSPRSTVA